MKSILFALIITLSLPLAASAGWGHWDNYKPPTNNAPLDGGLSLLLAAGAGYGIKRYAQSKKKNTEK